MKNSTGDLHDGGENLNDEHQMDDNEVFDNCIHSLLS
jgi:hypothetical protein